MTRSLSAQVSTDDRIEGVLEKLKWHGFATLAREDLGHLAREMGLSYSRFHHLFKKHMGIAPAHYVKRARLQEAKRLLEESAVPVKQIMLSVGFVDPSHFSRDFKQFTGLSPSSYRESATRRLNLTAE
jgi:transcriptional regulator GlxA family with amidase domain